MRKEEEAKTLMGKEEKANREEVPAGQTIFDNIFLWLALGLLITGVLYSVWGLIETLGVVPAP